jgi:hypothetical protein
VAQLNWHFSIAPLARRLRAALAALFLCCPGRLLLECLRPLTAAPSKGLLTVAYWNDGEEWENGSFPWASFAADPSHSGSDSES